MDALFVAELNERLFTHFTHGAWRAPYSQRLAAVRLPDTSASWRIACADARDMERAFHGLRQTGAPPPLRPMIAALHDIRETIAAARLREGFADTLGKLPVSLPLPGQGPFVLLSAASLPVGQLAAVLLAGAQTGGLVWKPAPGAAVSAHLLMRVLGPLAGGRLAMVQGDHDTGAALAGMAPWIWAGPGDPPAALPAPAVTVRAPVPARP
ncbi:MAG: hypothetical protein HLUCCA12_10765 [Rhodobacteraceae bacterium HLUCCA12]|nr:MAG: hypothetical protein HLUCCA12_10765 [Rhodobacteraceae bacterium HLUCCA12]